jgi:imidazolonepropionase-like amidohydrolase
VPSLTHTLTHPRTSRPLAVLLGVAAGLLFGLAAEVEAQDLALMNANVVDVVDGSVRMGVTVTIRDGTIAAIEEGGAPPAGVQTVDLAGRYLAPGLMDAHVHVGSGQDAHRALLTGVTTMRSMGASHYADVGMRELQRAGHGETPEYLAAGYHVRPQMAEEFFQDHPELGVYDGGGVTGLDAVRAVTRAIVSRDVDFVKTNATERAGLPNTDPRKQLYDQAEIGVMVEEAAAAGIGVAAHAHGDAGGRAAVMAGVRSIEHGTYLSETTLSMMAERGTYLVPTIAIVRDLTIAGGDYDNAALNIRGRHMLPRVQEMARNAHALGVKIVAATDTGYGPNSTTTLAHELIELTNIGMSPLEALQAATVTAAELFGMENRVGRVEPGMEADLIVLERNPLRGIDVVQDVLMVVSDGEVIVQRGDWPGRPVS